MTNAIKGKKVKKICLIVLALVAMSACSSENGIIKSPPEVSRQVPVTGAFVSDSIRWCLNSRPECYESGSYQFLWKAYDVNGKFEICGIGSHKHSNSRSASTSMMQRTSITLNGEIILTDMRFFNDPGFNVPLQGKMANCHNTGIDVPKGRWTVYMDIPRFNSTFKPRNVPNSQL